MFQRNTLWANSVQRGSSLVRTSGGRASSGCALCVCVFVRAQYFLPPIPLFTRGRRSATAAPLNLVRHPFPVHDCWLFVAVLASPPPRADEEEDEEFAWGDDDQDDEGHDRQNKTDAPTADAAPAGGALGAMDVAHQDAATTPRRRHSEGSALLSVPGGPAGKDRSSEGEVAVATGDAVASAEIARLTEALASMSGKAEKMTRERDAALAEVSGEIIKIYGRNEIETAV